MAPLNTLVRVWKHQRADRMLEKTIAIYALDTTFGLSAHIFTHTHDVKATARCLSSALTFALLSLHKEGADVCFRRSARSVHPDDDAHREIAGFSFADDHGAYGRNLNGAAAMQPFDRHAGGP